MIEKNQKPYLSLSIIVPLFNEEATVRRFIDDLMKVLISLNNEFEVIVVNDGSTDSTNDELKSIKVKYYNKIMLITHPYNKGNGASIKSGIKASTKEYLVCLDGDGQHNPIEIPKLLKYIPTYDLVVGERKKSYKGVWYRNIANKVYNRFASVLVGFAVKDLTSGFRIFDSKIIKRYVHLLPNKFSYPTTSTLLFFKNGHNVKYCPINVETRKLGNSKISIFQDGYRFFIIILKLILTYDPFKVFFPIAISLFTLGAISTVYSIYNMGRLFIPNSAVFLFTTSIIVLLLGIISGQISTVITSMFHNNK